jgi:glycosyltransferase involved in cell wall biosynthesis
LKIYCHTLFKNEERWLWYSVCSVIDHVDKVLLWDTGSTDNSWNIALELKKRYKDKIDLRQYGTVTPETFPKARQEMLDSTDSEWFIVVDGDEIWWDNSIRKLISNIKKADKNTESVVVPTVNLIGDVYHQQSLDGGRYKFGDLVGHYNLRAIKKRIPGLHSQGKHGVWGWADDDNQQIQDRNTFKFVDSPYIHATFLERAKNRNMDEIVPKRTKKYKYEIGEMVALDYYYPEVFFREHPEYILSPWKKMTNIYYLRAIIETPFKKIRRRFKNEKIGY